MESSSKFAQNLASARCFAGLDAAQLEKLYQFCSLKVFASGETVFVSGGPVDELAIILSGRLSAQRKGETAYDIGKGQAVEEVAFFTQRPAQSTVLAIRETVCLVLGWGDLLAAFQASPNLLEGCFAALFPSAISGDPANPRPSRLVICPAGAKEQLDPQIKARLISGFEALAEMRLLSADSFGAGKPGGITFEDPENAYWLQEQELAFDLTIIFADPADGEYARNALDEADETLLVATGSDAGLGPLETHAFAARGGGTCRFVLPKELGIRPKYLPSWTTPRPCRSIQSIDFTSAAAVERLCSNILGKGAAIAAASRGVYAAAILGAIQAFEAHNLLIDSFGAAGSAVLPLGLLAHGASLADIEGAFVALARPTIWKRASRPDASLFETGPIDRVLAEIVPGSEMAVPERPFAAVCHSLSLGAAEVWRTAKLREAVRASLMPPGILPPLVTEDGAVLISGEAEITALCNAVRALTASPVFFLHAKPPAVGNVEKPHRYLSGSPFRLGALQGSATGRLPSLDSIFAAVPNHATAAVDARNHFLIPIPAGIGPLDWSEWSSLRDIGFEWTSSELARRR